MHLSDFTNEVKGIVGNEQYIAHGHVLIPISHTYHERCIDTLRMGFNIPDTARHISTGKNLPPANYSRYLKFLTSKKAHQFVA